MKALEVLKKNMLAHDPPPGLGRKMTEIDFEKFNETDHGKETLIVVEKSMHEFSQLEISAFIEWFREAQHKYTNTSTEFLYNKWILEERAKRR